eukprot:403369368
MSPFSSAVIEKFGSRFAVKVGSFSYFLYISALLFPTLKEQYPDSQSVIFTDGFIISIIIIFAIINGIGSSLLWCGQGQYLTECANETSKGLFFAILNGTSNSSQLIGNIMSALLLANIDKFTYFIIMASIAAFASIFFLFLRPPRQAIEYEESQTITVYKQGKDYNQQSVVKKINQGDTCMNETVRTFTDTNFKDLHKIPHEGNQDQTQNLLSHNETITKPKKSTSESLKGTFGLLKTRKMLILVPYIAQVGITNGLSSGIFVPMLSATMGKDSTQGYQFEQSLFVMSALGAGEIFGGFLMNYIIKHYQSNKAGIIFHTFLSSVGFIALIVYTAIFSYNPLAYIFSFAFGMMDSASNTHLGMTCGFEFDDLNVEAMGINYMIKPLFICISVFIESGIDSTQKQHMLIYYSLCFVLYLFSYALVYFKFPFREVKQSAIHRISKDISHSQISQ